MHDLDRVLTETPRAVFAAVGAPPVASCLPFWWDGASMWVTGALAAPIAARLRSNARAAAYVPPSEAGGPGVTVFGSGRVYGLGDPVALVLHGPAIAAALGALALKVAPDLPGYMRDLPQLPIKQWPSGLVVVRLTVEQAETVTPPAAPRGMGPALPSVVPPPVRRSLSGARQVTVATRGPDADAPSVVPAVWSTGLRLATETPLPEGVPAAVVVDGGRDGLVLEGTVSNGSLVCDHARWWQGLATGHAAVPVRAAGGIDLPD